MWVNLIKIYSIGRKIDRNQLFYSEEKIIRNHRTNGYFFKWMRWAFLIQVFE